MVRHHNRCIQFNKWKMAGNRQPILPRDVTYFRQDHFSICHMAEITFPLVRANGYKISGVRAVFF